MMPSLPARMTAAARDGVRREPKALGSAGIRAAVRQLAQDVDFSSPEASVPTCRCSALVEVFLLTGASYWMIHIES